MKCKVCSVDLEPVEDGLSRYGSACVVSITGYYCPKCGLVYNKNVVESKEKENDESTNN